MPDFKPYKGKYLRTTDYARYLTEKHGRETSAQTVNNWRRRGKVKATFFPEFKEPFFDMYQTVPVKNYDKV